MMKFVTGSLNHGWEESTAREMTRQVAVLESKGEGMVVWTKTIPWITMTPSQEHSLSLQDVALRHTHPGKSGSHGQGYQCARRPTLFLTCVLTSCKSICCLSRQGMCSKECVQ